MTYEQAAKEILKDVEFKDKINEIKAINFVGKYIIATNAYLKELASKHPNDADLGQQIREELTKY